MPDFPNDPILLGKVFWPDVHFYDVQRELIYSVRDTPWTSTRAANQMGKDYVAGFIALGSFLFPNVFLRRPGDPADTDEVRIITTSVKDDHLRVLWGEIGRFIQSSQIPLTTDKGGLLIFNHRELRKLDPRTREPDQISYCRGQVSEKGEGMAGHHAPNTLLIIDEASGVEDEVRKQGEGWAKRVFEFGNPNPCTNRFRKVHKEGSVKDQNTGRFLRRVFQIKAKDSPNVRAGFLQEKAGEKVSNVVPGVLSLEEFRYRLLTWDPVRKRIGLDAEFWEGADSLLFPPEWLDRAEALAAALRGRPRKAKAIGCDPGEGTANSSWVIGDELGVIERESHKTPDTTFVVSKSIALLRYWGVDPSKFCMDRGGGGKQHADTLRAKGYPIRTVGFGESLTQDPRRGIVTTDEKIESREVKYAYLNRRAQMYGMLRELMDPSGPGYALGAEFNDIREQLALLPLLYDGEGRLYLPPKTRKDPNSKVRTLIDIIGHSPDEADATVLMVYALKTKPARRKAGVVG